MKLYIFTRFQTSAVTAGSIVSGAFGLTASAISLGCGAIVCALWDVANEIRDKK